MNIAYLSVCDLCKQIKEKERDRVMEGVSGRTRYWKKKKGYQRLDGWGFHRKNRVEIATLGENQRKKRFTWKIKIKRKLRLFKFSSPKKFLTSIKDGYVKMMLGLANSRIFASGGGFAYGGGAIDHGFRSAQLKEYDEKMIIEIYKSLMVQGQLVPREALKTSEAVVCGA